MTTKRKPLGRLRVFAAALLTASLTFSHAACGGNENRSAATENVNNTSGPVASAPPAPTPTPQEEKEAMSQDPIADNLVIVLKDWSGEEIATVNRGAALSSMWLLKHSSAIPYDPDGIDGLIKKIRKHSFFKDTPRVREQVKKLKRGFFVVGGGIQNQGQLYDFLAA